MSSSAQSRHLPHAAADAPASPRERRVVPPIFIEPDLPLMFESVAEAEGWLQPEMIDPGEIGYDSEGRLLQLRVVEGQAAVPGGRAGRRRRVEITAAEDDPGHVEDLRRALVSWLVEPGHRGPDLSRAPLLELIERARVQTRRGLWGPSGFTSILRFLGVLLGVCVYPALASATHWAHVVGHAPLPGLEARSRAASILMYAALVPAAVAAGSFLAHALAWMLPVTRRSMQWDEHQALGARRTSLRRRLAALGLVLAASLLVALGGALLPL